MTIQDLLRKDFFQRCDFAEGFPGRARDLDRWLLLADRFDAFEARREAPPVQTIPRRIHQIWVGGTLPPSYQRWTNTWVAINRDWEYRLWDEKGILAFGLRNERAFLKSRSPGARSDIARYEILERLGGIYVDTDFECLRPFDDLVDRCSLFAGLLFSDTPEISNGLVGIAAGHPLLRRLVEGLEEPIMSRDGMEILALSGPLYFTRTFFGGLGGTGKSDVVLPSSYFFPLPNFVPAASLGDVARRAYAREWSLAIHHWETSWLRPSPIRAFLSRAKRYLRA